ncbi:hypothetical protein NFI96_011221, partial [Prochilodus magdalenae]
MSKKFSKSTNTSFCKAEVSVSGSSSSEGFGLNETYRQLVQQTHRKQWRCQQTLGEAPQTSSTHPPGQTFDESYSFLGTTITKDLKGDCTICSTIRKAQQRVCFLRQLRKFNLSQELMVQFYTAPMESFITSSITGWGSSATKHDIHRLQRIIRPAEKTTGVKLPTLLDLHTSRTRKIITDPSHPGYHRLQCLPSGWRFRQANVKTTRLQRRFSLSVAVQFRRLDRLDDDQ